MSHVDTTLLWRDRLMAIVDETAAEHGVSRKELLGISRLQHIAEARAEAMLRCRERTSYSWSTLGEFFMRDHSTVASACRTATQRRQA